MKIKKRDDNHKYYSSKKRKKMPSIFSKYYYQTNYQFYKKYHSNFYNKLVHIFCIPGIVYSLLGLLMNLESRFSKGEKNKKLLSLALYGLYMVYYYMIAPKHIFRKTLMFYSSIYMASDITFDNMAKSSGLFLAIQILSWALQLLSHRFIEKNSPAFKDGFTQSFLTAPVFVVDEVVKFVPKIKFWPVVLALFGAKMIYGRL